MRTPGRRCSVPGWTAERPVNFMRSQSPTACGIWGVSTWRWHHLLRGGRGTLLSPEEQKGLLGELFVLERLLLPSMDASSAVTAWRGPLGAPKDFEIARVAVEAKTHCWCCHTVSLNHICSSQLDERGVDSLFLHVVELDEAPTDAMRRGRADLPRWAFSKHGCRRRATGRRTTIPATFGFYLVAFPRTLRWGVSNVRYSVSLAERALRIRR